MTVAEILGDKVPVNQRPELLNRRFSTAKIHDQQRLARCGIKPLATRTDRQAHATVGVQQPKQERARII